jgi:hypothetical protein
LKTGDSTLERKTYSAAVLHPILLEVRKEVKQLLSCFSFVAWLLWIDSKEVRVLAEVQGCSIEVSYDYEREEPELKKKMKTKLE